MVMEVISAEGEIHQPTILLKGKNFMICYLEHWIVPAMYGNTECGWATNAEVLRWLCKTQEVGKNNPKFHQKEE